MTIQERATHRGFAVAKLSLNQDPLFPSEVCRSTSLIVVSMEELTIPHMAERMDVIQHTVQRWCNLTDKLAHPTRCATSSRQAGGKQMEEIVENRQEVLTLLISSEGREHLTEIVSLFAVPPVFLQSKKGGDAGDRNTLLRRSPPRITCEPIAPTPAVM